jgi:hypothetical protein
MFFNLIQFSGENAHRWQKWIEYLLDEMKSYSHWWGKNIFRCKFEKEFEIAKKILSCATDDICIDWAINAHRKFFTERKRKTSMGTEYAIFLVFNSKTVAQLLDIMDLIIRFANRDSLLEENYHDYCWNNFLLNVFHNTHVPKEICWYFYHWLTNNNTQIHSVSDLEIFSEDQFAQKADAILAFFPDKLGPTSLRFLMKNPKLVDVCFQKMAETDLRKFFLTNPHPDAISYCNKNYRTFFPTFENNGSDNISFNPFLQKWLFENETQEQEDSLKKYNHWKKRGNTEYALFFAQRHVRLCQQTEANVSAKRFIHICVCDILMTDSLCMKVDFNQIQQIYTNLPFYEELRKKLTGVIN